MIANILIIGFIVLWLAGTVWYFVKNHKEARKAGIPVGCCGCLNHKTCCSKSGGECHCNDKEK